MGFWDDFAATVPDTDRKAIEDNLRAYVASLPKGEVTAYQPSWRDRIGQAIAGDSRMGDVRYNLAHGLLGSAGVGGSGGGLLDFTPVGIPLSANDAARAFERGDYVGGMVDAAGVLGAVVPPMMAAKSAKPLAGEGISRASKSLSMYDPPVRPQRPFADDYQRGINAPEGSPLALDMEGRPLTARFVAGRRTVGGDDQGLRPEDVVAITEAISGARPKSVAGQAIGGKAGSYEAIRQDGDIVKRVFINNKLDADPANKDRVISHETGHVIADHAGDMPDVPYMRRMSKPGPQTERGLARVYNDLNYPRDDWRWRSQEKPDGEPMKLKYGVSPEDFRYSPKDWPSEFQAEAIRAYLMDPNYLKSTAPKVAEAIRKYVNSHPRLKDIIQFNTVAPIGAAGLAASARGEDQ